MPIFSNDVLVWTFYFEKPGKSLTAENLGEWDQAMEDSFGSAIDAACENQQVPTTKTNRSQILALSVVTRGSELAERVKTATKFYKKSVLTEEIL